MEAGIAFVREVLADANNVKRQTVPASELTVALQCGGSDGYSGVSANPALGLGSDLVVRHGGTVILSETTETYGAEHLLTRRAVSREVGEKLVELMRWWEEYTRTHGAEIECQSVARQQGRRTDHNPGKVPRRDGQGREHQPGRRAIKYAEADDGTGFVFMDTPGFDPVSATGQVAGGANVICFTTGRGSVFRLQARALDQDRHQHAYVPAHGRRHGRQLRDDP